jgi:hypothetical protein
MRCPGALPCSYKESQLKTVSCRALGGKMIAYSKGRRGRNEAFRPFIRLVIHPSRHPSMDGIVAVYVVKILLYA